MVVKCKKYEITNAFFTFVKRKKTFWGAKELHKLVLI